MDYYGLLLGIMRVLVSIAIGFLILGIIDLLFTKYDRN